MSKDPNSLEPTPGIEPGTSSLPRKCSTAELCGPTFKADSRYILPLANGAGDGNRTHTTSLEGWGSTVELHPQT